MNSARRLEKISKKGNKVQLYHVINLPKNIPQRVKNKNKGIKKEIYPKISIKKEDKYEPKAPRIFELSSILESYLKNYYLFGYKLLKKLKL